MRRLATLVCVLLMSVMLWSGATVRAAELAACVNEVRAEAPGHFDGDGDQVPADTDKGAPHHHGACHAHCVAVPNTGEAPAWASQPSSALSLRSTEFLSGLDPGTALRPPIA